MPGPPVSLWDILLSGPSRSHLVPKVVMSRPNSSSIEHAFGGLITCPMVRDDGRGLSSIGKIYAKHLNAILIALGLLLVLSMMWLAGSAQRLPFATTVGGHRAYL